MCVASHSLLPVATPMERLHRPPRRQRQGRREGGEGLACYQRARWTVNTKSLTCDLLGGRTARAGGKKGAVVCLEVFGEEILWGLWGAVRARWADQTGFTM